MSKIICPKCKSKNVVPILYGYLSHELTITYADNRQRKFYGDLSGGTMDGIAMKFLYLILEMKAKIECEEMDEEELIK